MLSDPIKSTLNRIEVLSHKKLFFIVGMPRSGTTWLQRALDSHDEICCRGESHFVDILLKNFQAAMQSFNNNVRQQGGAVAHLAKFGGHVKTLNYDTHDLQLLLYYSMYIMFDKWVDSSDIKILGEKTPDNIWALNLLGSIFPDVHVVHVVRDGRDCAASGWFFNKSGLDKGKAVAQSFDSYVLQFTKQWKAGIEFARRTSRQLGNRYMEVVFENMVVDPIEEITRICRFLGATDSEQTISRCVDASRFDMVTGGRKAGEENPDAFFRKGVAGDWRNHLSSKLAEEVWDQIGDALSECGYARD